MTHDFAEIVDNPIRRLVICATLVGVGVTLYQAVGPTASDRLIRRAASLLSAERYAEAERLAIEALNRQPQNSLALLIAGEAAVRQERDDDAIRYFRQVEDDESDESVHALFRAGERLIATGHAREAEHCLRRALDHDPWHIRANKRLAVLLQIQGRTWESAPYIRNVLLGGLNAKDHLLMVGAIDTTFIEDYQVIENCLESDAANQVVLVGRARQQLTKSRFSEAEQILTAILAKHPDSLEAHARLGRIFVDRSADAQFLEWRRNLPKNWDSHPEVWYVQGLWLRRNGQRPAAIRYFLEAARRDPNHRGAVLQLSQLLRDSKYSDIAERLSARSQRLSQLHYLLMEVRFGYNADLVRMIIDLLDALERNLEAVGWCEILQQWKLGHHEWARGRELDLHRRLHSGRDLTPPSANLASGIDANEFPQPVWPQDAERREELPLASPREGNIRFDNMASEVGIHFQYVNGTTATEGLQHIVQATGGGIAVIDFDQDGWEDLYFVQSSPFPIQAGQTRYTDRLFRNLGNGRFEDVTEAAGVADADYGQGVAVGDYNNDGYPDLYVANFGGNRLYQNSGDGTFIDVTERATVSADRWTTSCMIADLNNDSLPEIYAATYSLKDQVLSLHCEYDGRPRTCAPTLLTADQDLLYRNLGDGRFEDVSDRSGIVAPDGKGLGVIAADFEERGSLDVFVANDTAANFLFRNETKSPGDPLSFKEQAILRGAGFDELGNAQANMGLALGDVNRDGRLDMFVTTFYGESNTLFLQNEDHGFVDAARRANVRESGFHMLGFGAQFIDGELDGWPDLVITNGHIDFTFAHGNPDRMPPQYLRNVGNGRYDELTAESLGPYFQERYFGRALAKLDWNRDGREDVCISHLDAPAALLTNKTATTGHFLGIKLCGVTSNRDAIGAIVTLEAGELKLVQHVAGGGGYFVSNQRHLLFGLGDAATIDRLSIRWPSGLTQVLENLAANQEIVVVEGGAWAVRPRGTE